MIKNIKCQEYEQCFRSIQLNLIIFGRYNFYMKDNIFKIIILIKFLLLES